MSQPRSISPPADPFAGPSERVAALVGHFRKLEIAFPQLALAESCWLTQDDEPADAEDGFLISYCSEQGEGEVRLWISSRRVKLKGRWEDDRGFSALEERFTVNLDDQPAWGGARFDSMASFAAALVALMRRRLTDLPVLPDHMTGPPTTPPIRGDATSVTAGAGGVR